MADDLRVRLEAALEPHTHNGHLVDAELGDVLDAVMPVVEERLFRAHHWDRGKCRWCRAIVSENLAKGLGKQIQPHRMTCQFYVGTVEHRRIRSHESWAGLAVWHDCSCGKSWNGNEHDGCPNLAETWRGPKEGVATVNPPRGAHKPYCEGAHGQSVTCAQVATWRRDAARDPWRCWHNPGEGQLRHWFQGQNVCRYDGCGQRLSELQIVSPGAHHERDPEDAP